MLKCSIDRVRFYTATAKKGLIDACRFHNRSIKGLWIIVLSSIAGFAGSPVRIFDWGINERVV